MNINDDIFKSKNSENDDFTEFADDDSLYNDQDECRYGHILNMKNAKTSFHNKTADTKNRKSSKSHKK